MKFFTKFIIGLIILLIVVLIFYKFSLKQVDYDFVFVDNQKEIPEKACNELNDQVLVITKTGCPACAKAEPILEEIEKEKNLEFKYLNLAVEEERNELLKLGFIPTAFPSIIINCKNYEGALSKEKYLELLGIVQKY